MKTLLATILLLLAAPAWAQVVMSGTFLMNGTVTGAGGGLPDQAGHSGEYLTTNGTTASWAALAGGGDVVASGTLTLNSLLIGGGGTTAAATSTAAGALDFLGTPSSANLAALVTGETGSGALVFGTSPTLTTPVLGVATATSLNGNTFTTGTYTLTGAASKTLTFSNTLTLAGTDGTTMTFPSTSATVARTDAANTFTGASTASAWVLTSPTITTGIVPTSNDGAALGSTANQFSDLFLAEGGVINWDNGDATLTQASNVVTLAGATLAADIGTSTATTASAGASSTLVATTAYTDTAAKSAFLGTYASPDTTAGAVTLTQAVTTIWTNTTTEYDLPAVASNTGKAIIFYVVGTNLITLDPNASEIIVRAGTAQTGGVTMTLAGVAGNYVCIICDGTRWVTLGYSGTLAAGS